ncbi:hypothetical protein LITTLEE_103 [Mycobacterium phage LittleE]|uniref:Uncharacterized protein n=3 Tax=Omegavirus TaxID=1623292 RepID=G1D3Y8_9CAUD|nr:hypothetical protein CM09_gp095 [Mycobacterium phage Courthouse]YP_009205229.1 hypothetical protein AVT17_gp099 [Mycobacterium phage Ariel]YP_009213317.1 hypothetical protein AVV70_gp100 [Mycobacterium phage MiaZeal]YP_009637014.1 hypothetical protein FGG27_gp103 [Mycobacterium phage LittleE]ASD50870.1 hypothetical protein PORCELAIN_98 [Mycobacterium phage Porcelain]ASZ74174.1 hypothetical protein SEA_SQUINT_98 [Mycobacterium phage Squint]ATS92939.1 hypothetical protein SEA_SUPERPHIKIMAN_9
MKDSSEPLRGSDRPNAKVDLEQILGNWRPACGLREDMPALPVCGNPATHVLNFHGGHFVHLTCIPCYYLYMEAIRQGIETFPKVECTACGEGVDALVHLKLTPL